MSMERNVTKRTLLTCEHWDISVLTLRSSVSKYQIFVTKFTEFVGLEGLVSTQCFRIRNNGEFVTADHKG